MCVLGATELLQPARSLRNSFKPGSSCNVGDTWRVRRGSQLLVDTVGVYTCLYHRRAWR